MGKVSRWLRDNNIIVIVVVTTIIFYLINPRFLSGENVVAISRQIVPIGLIVLGQFFVLVSGNIDLSMGMSSVFFAILLGVFFGMLGGVVIGIIAVFVVSLMLGAINGYFIGKVKVPAFIVTLATMFIVTGLSGLIIPPRQMIFLRGGFFKFIGSAKLFGMYYSTLILLVLFVIAWFLYNKTKFGGYVIAIGDNEENAKLVGINVTKMKMIIFMISAFCSGLAGIILSSRMGFVQPGLDGASIMMDAITAIIIGGTLLQGGKGTVGGVFWGLLFIGIINNSLNLLNVQDVWHQVFKGIVIIAALVLNWAIRKQSGIEAH
ncbi:MAG: ABC transporter permease [Spirochaetales bacterium]|uniref:ABC transporter permease n=1 Tax=Candidatus Thalassospirochaeta sargassi TaxID=3119039 RepID=A0AAJ1IHB4_9SPIO|nr:ABC transporter permease [Spirochaetales bacterium]